MARINLRDIISKSGYDGGSDDRFNPALNQKQNGSANSVGTDVPGKSKSDQTEDGLRKTRDQERSPSEQAGNTASVGLKEGGFAKNIASSASAPVMIAGLITKRQAILGGGTTATGIVVTLILIFLSSFGLVNTAEILRGEGNRGNNIISRALQRRRTNSLFVLIKKGSQNLQTELFVRKARTEGFEVVARAGKVRTLSKGNIVFDFDRINQRDLTRRVIALQESVGGREFLNSLDNVTKESAARFSGIVTRQKVMQRLGVNALIDWIGARRIQNAADADRAPPVSERAILADAGRNADQTTDNALARITDEGALARLGAAEEGVERSTFNVGDDIARQADELSEQIAAANGGNVTIAGEGSAGRIAGASDDIAGAFASAGTASEGAVRDLVESAARNIGGSVGRKSLDVLAAGFDVGAVPRQGCRVAGTLEFIKSVRNVLVAAELAKFAIRFYTIADHQKAGLVEESSVKLMSLYIAGASGSGGMQWLSTGGAATVSAVGISQYGVGYADVGILAGIATFIRSVPGLDPENCSVINNPLTQVGGTLIGGAISVLSGGTATGFNFAWAMSLTLANEVAFAVATPLLIRAAAGEVVTWFEEQPGDLLASSAGSFQAASATANGTLPTSTESFIEQDDEAQLAQEEKYASQSIFERYLNIKNPQSLLAKASMPLPGSIQGAAEDISSYALNGGSNFIQNSLQLTGSATKKAYAQTTNQCEDSAVIEYDIATDPFCNIIPATVPILDVDRTEEILRAQSPSLISLTGEPQGEFEDFVENCFSGRSGVLHPPEVSREGETASNDPTCVLGINDGPLPGDNEAVTMQDGTFRVPTKKERFAAWYGLLVDTQTLTADINDNLIGTIDATERANTNIYILGDSLTVGMQSLAGSDSQRTYMERTFEEAGWTAEVDAQGCRAVYQTEGPINGDGRNCPAQTIVDGIDAVERTSFLDNDNAGTVLIGLGTNGYETTNGSIDNELFREKARELIRDIRAKSPSSYIYWTDLTSENVASARQTVRNDILRSLEGEFSNFAVLGWDGYVRSAEGTPDTADDAPFADQVHHNAAGYRQKVAFHLRSIPLPQSASSTTSLNGLGMDGTAIECRVDQTSTPNLSEVVRSGQGAPYVDWTNVPNNGTIGEGTDGNPIYVYVREACVNDNVKTIFLGSSTHGSENGGQMVSYKMLFKVDLPDNVRIIAVPEINKFGVTQSAEGRGFAAARVNGRGVNINRNFDYEWAGLASNAATRNYKGASAASEPETAAVQNLLNSLGRIDLAISYHDTPDSYTAAAQPNTPVEYASVYASRTPSAPLRNRENGTVGQSGSLESWYNERHGTPGLLVEMSNTQTETVIDTHVRGILALVENGVL